MPSPSASPSPSLASQPFDLLLSIEQRLRRARLDVTSGTGETLVWTGLGFRLQDAWFVAPREDVREVSMVPKLTRIPGAKPWLIGVANLRGSLLPVTDLAQLFGQPRAPEQRAQRILVLNLEGVPAGFLVDEVAGHRQFNPADQRHELAAKAASFERCLLGAFVREGREWRVLSLRKVARDEAFAHAGA